MPRPRRAASASPSSSSSGRQPSVQHSLPPQYTGVEQVRPLIALGDTLDQISPLPLVVFAGAASLLIVRTGSLPRWIGWLGALTAILSALGALDTVDAESLLDKVGLMALVLWLVWMIAVNISLLRRRGERSETVRHRRLNPLPTSSESG